MDQEIFLEQFLFWLQWLTVSLHKLVDHMVAASMAAVQFTQTNVNMPFTLNFIMYVLTAAMAEQWHKVKAT